MTGIGALPDGTYTAVVDSVEDGIATLSVEDDGEQVGHAECELAELPEDGRHVDAVLLVTIVSGTAVRWTHDPGRALNDDAQERLTELAEWNPSDGES